MSNQPAAQAEREARAELARLETVIASTNILPRRGRDLHDWLAQILQVLMVNPTHHECANRPAAVVAEREACAAIARQVADQIKADRTRIPAHYWEELAVLDAKIKIADGIEAAILARGTQ